MEGKLKMKSLEERARDFAEKAYTNAQRWQKGSNCIIALGESCYIKGAKDQREIDVKKMCDYMCKICKNNSDDGPFECTSEEKEMCCILNIKAIRSFMEE